MTNKDIKLYIASKPLPFTEINGYRPAMFSFDHNTTESENINFVERLKVYSVFEPVDYGSFSYKRDDILNAIVNVDAEKFPRLDYNYAIVELGNETLCYFINKVKPLQNNVNQLTLKVDVVTTYFWKLDINTRVGVDRLNYNILQHKDLLENTIGQTDETVTNIPKTMQIMPKPSTELNIKHYSYRELTSNQINDYFHRYNKNIYFDGFITELYNKDKIQIPDNSNTIYYNFAYPLISQFTLLTNGGGYHTFNKSSYNITKFTAKGTNVRGDVLLDPVDITSLDRFPDIRDGSAVIRNWTTERRLFNGYMVVDITNSFYCITHSREETHTSTLKFNNSMWSSIDLFNKYLRDYNMAPILDFFMSDEYIKANMSDEYFPPIITFSPISNQTSKVNVPWLFDYVPPIREILELYIAVWNGKLIPVDTYDITWSNSPFLEYNISSLPTPNEIGNYLSFTSGITNIHGASIDNNIEIPLQKKMNQRYDSKTEYLASNNNSILAERKTASDNAILGTLKSLVSIPTALFSPLDLAIKGGNTAYGMLNVPGAILGYTNKVNQINGRILDIGNSRSNFTAGEGDLTRLDNPENLKYFEANGTNFLMRIPSGDMMKTLKRHYYRFGSKLNTYLSIKEIFEKTQENEHFTYIKLKDTSILYAYSEIPHEALRLIDDLLTSGVHFWKAPFQNDYRLGFNDITKTKTLDGTYYIGSGELNEKNTMEV